MPDFGHRLGEFSKQTVPWGDMIHHLVLKRCMCRRKCHLEDGSGYRDIVVSNPLGPISQIRNIGSKLVLEPRCTETLIKPFMPAQL